MKMSEPFYQDGLKFECTRCSNCCRHDSGYVFLSADDLTLLLDAANMKREAFITAYCRVVNINGFQRLSLKELDNFDCIFWVEAGCKVYNERPLQCRSYPFWSHNLESEKTWNDTSRECPGVNKGRTHSCEDIERWLKERAQAEFIIP